MLKFNHWKATLLFFILSVSLYGSQSQFLVTYKSARVYSSPDAFSKQVTRLPFGTKVQVSSTSDFWLKANSTSPKASGYIHVDALIDQEGFDRQTKSINEQEMKTGQKGFGSEDLTAGAKGFGQEDITAGTKGFGQDDTAAGAKGFNEGVEANYKKQNKGYRYDLVDQIDRSGEIADPQRTYYSFRQSGKLGEFGSFRNAGK